MRNASDLAHGLFAKAEQRGVECDRLYVPNARPFHRTLFLAGKTLAGLLRLAVHAGQNLRVQVALI